MALVFALGKMKKAAQIVAVMGISVSGTTQTSADEVRITRDMEQFEYNFAGKTYVIRRNQDNEARVPDAYAKTSRTCPIFCVQPYTPAKGVETFGELELLKFLEEYVSTGEGFLIDSRTKDWYDKGTIPGAVNLPYNVFVPSPENVFFDSVMNMLGGTKSEFEEWTFEDPKNLLLFCNGPWCGQSPTAIRNLLAINYPAEKLHYYRGGMQNWVGMGFITEIPNFVVGSR